MRLPKAESGRAMESGKALSKELGSKGSARTAIPLLSKSALDSTGSLIRLTKLTKGCRPWSPVGVATITAQFEVAWANRKPTARLSPEQRLLVEYNPFEPAFYHTDIADWGMAEFPATLRHSGQAQREPVHLQRWSGSWRFFRGSRLLTKLSSETS